MNTTAPISLCLAAVRFLADATAGPEPSDTAGFHVDRLLFFATAFLAVALCGGLIWVWRQKSESEEALKEEQAKLKIAESRWRTQQQGLEGRLRKIEEQTADVRSAPREQAVFKKGGGKNYHQEFDSASAREGGQKTHAGSADAVATLAKSTTTSATAQAEGRLALETQRLDEQRQELKSLREKLAQDRDAYERRLADDRKRQEAEVKEQYREQMAEAAAATSRAAEASAAAAAEMNTLAAEKQRVDEARQTVADARRRVDEDLRRLDEIQKAQDRERAALEHEKTELQQSSLALGDSRRECERRQQDLDRREETIKSLEADVQSRRSQMARQQKELEEKESLHARRTGALAEETARVRGVETAAESRFREAESRDRQAEGRRQAAEQLESKASIETQQAAQARKSAEENREQARQDLALWQGLRSQIEQIRQSFWPDGFRNGPLASWQDRLEKSVADGDPDARMLLSFVHVYYAADAAATDTKNLRDALKEISRYLFKYLARTDAAECGRQGILWAEELNKNGKGRFSIQLPSVGDPIDANWMIRPSSNVPNVSAVITWAVRDAKGIATHRAEVS